MPETRRYSEDLDWEPPYFLKGGSRGVFRVRSMEEGFTISQYLRQMGEIPIAQKSIDGEPYSVAGIAYDGGVSALMIKKLKIAENGTTVFGVTVYDEDLFLTFKHMRKIDSRNPHPHARQNRPSE